MTTDVVLPDVLRAFLDGELIVSARDYADLATWRTRKAAALASRPARIDR